MIYELELSIFGFLLVREIFLLPGKNRAVLTVIQLGDSVCLDVCLESCFLRVYLREGISSFSRYWSGEIAQIEDSLTSGHTVDQMEGLALLSVCATSWNLYMRLEITIEVCFAKVHGCTKSF